MYLKMHKCMLWHYRACQPSDTALHVLPPSPLQVEELSSIWWFLVFPVSPWWPSVAMAVRVCSDPARLPRWFTAQSGTSLPFSGCPEQESSHAMGHPKNAVQMVATQQLAMHPASVWFTGADTANLFHYHFRRHFSCNQDVVIHSLSICSLSFERQEVYTNYGVFFPAGNLCCLKSCNRKNVTESQKDVLSGTSWIFCAETFLLKWLWLRFIQSSDTVKVKIRLHAKVSFDKQSHSWWSQRGKLFQGQFPHNTSLLCCKK